VVVHRGTGGRRRDQLSPQLTGIRCDSSLDTSLVWKEVENVEDFTNRIIGLTAKLRLLDDNITDAEVVHKLVQVVPNHLTQVAVSIETRHQEHLRQGGNWDAARCRAAAQTGGDPRQPRLTISM
jgi:hypothetical protein